MARFIVCQRHFIIGFFIGIAAAIVASSLFRVSYLTINKRGSFEIANQNDYNNSKHVESGIEKQLLTSHIDEVYKGNERGIKLAKSIRILCFVLVKPSIYLKAQAVKDTWGKRCNILLFMSSINDTKFGTIGLNVPEGHKNLWMKTRDAFKYVYEHYYHKADWFIKADDDTFLIVENLRYFLMSYNTDDGHFFGSQYKASRNFNGGGAGLVLSKKALKGFYHVTKDLKKCHPSESGAEDVYVTWCLHSLNIHPGDTRDKLGRHMFHQLTLQDEFYQKNKNEIWKSKVGRECCSDYSISYHHITLKFMYQLEYLIYDLRAYGN